MKRKLLLYNPYLSSSFNVQTLSAKLIDISVLGEYETVLGRFYTRLSLPKVGDTIMVEKFPFRCIKITGKGLHKTIHMKRKEVPAVCPRR